MEIVTAGLIFLQGKLFFYAVGKHCPVKFGLNGSKNVLL